MTIPSSVILDEIKEMGFNSKPYINDFGEICIGFGHRLVEDYDLISSFDEDLANVTKFYYKTELDLLPQTNFLPLQEKLMLMLLDCGLRISMDQANNLLLDDVIKIYEALVEKSSGFRRLINLCNGNFSLLSPPLSKKLLKEKNSLWKNLDYFVDDFDKTYQQNSKFKISPTPYTRGDSAAIRLDSIIKLSHILGLKNILAMKFMLASLRIDDYLTASSYLLTHSSSQKLKGKMVLLSRRLRYGIMFCDLSEPLPFNESIVPPDDVDDDDDFDFFCEDYEPENLI